MDKVIAAGLVLILMVGMIGGGALVAIPVPPTCSPVVIPEGYYVSGQAAWTPLIINKDNCPEMM